MGRFKTYLGVFTFILGAFIISPKVEAIPAPRLKPTLAVSVKPTKVAQQTVIFKQKRVFAEVIPYPRLGPHRFARKPSKPVIFIDAGHGGRDPGAIGVRGTYEKHITAKNIIIATGATPLIPPFTKAPWTSPQAKRWPTGSGRTSNPVAHHPHEPRQTHHPLPGRRQRSRRQRR